MKTKQIYIFAILCLLSAVVGVGAQEKTAMSADQTLRSNARVNPSTLGMELSIPLAGYRGRGANGVSVGLNYSSKVWRMGYVGDYPKGNTTECRGLSTPTYAEETASGWTSDLSVPFIEYTGKDNVYNDRGKAVNTMTVTCAYVGQPEHRFWVKRLTIHLPGGGSHELRADDGVMSYFISINGPLEERVQANWNTTFYSVDGSNLRYVEDSTTSTYRLYMPDGSTMDFSSSPSSIYSDVTMRSIRKAVKSTDTNGNFTTYHEPDVNHPNGYVTDTLGRTIDAPVGLEAPAAPTAPNQPQEYSVPGLSGVPLTYDLHWRYLEDALTDPNAVLCYRADGYPNPWEPDIPTGACTLFDFNGTFSVVAAPPSLGEFNPVVLSQIDLPSGQSYKFSYDIYGRIDKIEYPTGGVETFEYSLVPMITAQGTPGGDPSAEANFGVTHREVLESSTATPIEWTYSADRDDDWYKVTKTAPDDTKTEVYLKRGKGGQGVWYGYESVLVGYPYEQNTYDSNDNLLAKTLTTYEVSNPGGKERHPRVAKVESIIYDPAASTALSSSATTSYATIDSIDDPLLPVSSSQYGFTTSLGSLGTLLRTTETDYLSDSNYTARNLRSLPVEVRVKDAAGNVRSKTQFAYDELAYFDNNYTTTNWEDPQTVFRGNATTTRTWVSETSTWLETHSMFDNFGNVRKVWDTSGDATRFIETQYSSDYQYAYPTKTIAPAPDPTGVHGITETSEITRVYDLTSGRLLSITDALGQTATMEYNDPLYRPTRTVPPSGGSVSEIIYNDTPGNTWVKTRQQIDENNWAESMSYYDNLGRVTKTLTRDLQGNVARAVKYDEFGRVEKTSNPYRVDGSENPTETVYWSKLRYDERGRVVETFAPAPDGQTGVSMGTVDFGISTLSGFVGTYVVSTDASGRKSRAITGIFGLMRVDEATGIGGSIDQDLGTLASPNQATYYNYNSVGELTKITQGVQNRYFMYDSLGRLIRVRQPEQTPNANLATIGNPENNAWTMGYTYDVLGNVTSVTDANDVTITNTYDKAGRVVKRTYDDNTPEVEYFYDGKGLSQAPAFSKGSLTKVTSLVSEDRFTSFDNHGRLLSSQQFTDGQAYDFEYKYNLSGALIEETYPSGRVVRNFLDSDGGLSSVTTKSAWGQNTTVASNFDYSAAGNVKKMLLGNGLWETAAFDERHQLTQVGLGTTNSNNDLFKVDYEYGELNTDGSTVNTAKNVGNIAKATTTIPNASFVQTFKYDEIDRLTEAVEKTGSTQNWKQTFGYDRYGNRTNFYQIVGSTELTMDEVTKPEIDPATNRFTTGQGYVYDQNGNIVQDAEGRTFVFNGDDRQTEVKDTATGQTVGKYFYDGSGARVKKYVPGTGETTVFVYDAGGALAAEYSTVSAPSNPTTSYLTTDHLGSPRVVTDSDGEVISRRDFMPFGEELGAGVGARTVVNKYAASGTDNIRKRFTGYEKDDETGLDFAEARMYQNRHGRFTTVDPLLGSSSAVNPQTFNRYTYTGNNPINYTDPSGLQWCSDSNHVVTWSGHDTPCGSGFDDVTGRNGITSENTCFYGSGGTEYCRPKGAEVRFNGDGTITTISMPTTPHRAIGQGTAVEEGTNTIAGTTAEEAAATAASRESGGITLLPHSSSGGDGMLSLCGPEAPCPLSSDSAAGPIQRLDTSNNPPLRTIEILARAAEWGSLIPGLNVPFSIIAGIVRFGQGNFSQAGLNFAAVVPLGGFAKLKRLEKVSETAIDVSKQGTQVVEGIYEFTAKSGKTYIGQSKDIAARIKQHIASGKMLPGTPVNITEVLGGKTAREIAEQLRINSLGGIGNLENLRNPIGRARKYLLP